MRLGRGWGAARARGWVEHRSWLNLASASARFSRITLLLRAREWRGASLIAWAPHGADLQICRPRRPVAPTRAAALLTASRHLQPNRPKP